MASHVLFARSPDWALRSEQLEQLLLAPDFRVLKRTSRTLAGIVVINGAEVFVKRVTSSSWLSGVIARILGSRARKTIRGARILRDRGFLHPQLITALEHRERGSVSASYVIAEYLRRPKVLSRFALADGRDVEWRRTLSLRLAQTIHTLHTKGCYTRDLQETNLIVEATDGDLRFYFTDLEDFRRLPLVPWSLRLRNLLQLDRSIGRFVSRTHRLRFLHNYLGDGIPRGKVREIVAGLVKERARIERRKLHRERLNAIVTPVK